MTHMKKWIVTYTKHMKQKRKVYQDGVLELNVSGDKVMLYNDSEKLIDSKFLRKDEVIECGGTLALEVHLVDIGNSIEDQKPLENLNISNRDKKLIGSSGTQGDVGNNNKKVQREPLVMDSNVTRYSIGMNKKIGAVQSSTPETHPNSIHTILKEWNVLYTNQLTQKAKKYHDGILRLVQCGLHMKQMILLNEDGAVLSSKYLKSAESVESGIKYELPNYLLEIYEPRVLQEEVHQKSPSKQVLRSDVPRKSKLIEDLQKGHLEQALSSSGTAVVKSTSSRSGNPLSDEWNVSYTTQLTQKAKKYHDGILQLVQCGLHTKQIILLDEDGVTLSSRYLKSVEDIKSGIKCELPNYLIEICEPRILQKEILQKGPLEKALRSDNPRKNKFPSNEGDQPMGQLERTTSSSSTNIVNSKSRSNNPLRDACQILSTLKKRLPEAKCDIRELPLTQDQHSLSSDIILHDVESRSKTDINLPGMNPLGKIVNDSNIYGPIGGASQVYTSGSSSRKAETSSTFSGSDIIGPIGTEHEGRFPTHDHSISNNLFSGQVAAESSATKLDKCMDQISVGTTTSCTGFKVSDPNTNASSRMSQEIALENVDYGIPLSGRPSIYMDAELPLRDHPASPFSERGLCATHISMSHECKYESPDQILADTKEERCDMQSSDASAFTDMISYNSDFQSSSNKYSFIDEHPTFDLGF